MREIKFRVWADNIHIDKPKAFIGWERLNTLGHWEYCQKEDDPADYNSWHEGVLWSQSFPYLREQYTGLKDRNGVEIYEGDVLGGYPHGTAMVFWDTKYSCFATKSVKSLDNDSDLLANDLEDCGDAWQVIGNIHQNPELIK